jgi:hypothetical protein
VIGARVVERPCVTCQPFADGKIPEYRGQKRTAFSDPLPVVHRGQDAPLSSRRRDGQQAGMWRGISHAASIAHAARGRVVDIAGVVSQISAGRWIRHDRRRGGVLVGEYDSSGTMLRRWRGHLFDGRFASGGDG